MIFEGAPFDRTMVLDFETAWCTKSGYTLSKMTTEEYVRDSRFKAWGVGWKYFGDTKPAKWVPRKDLPAFFASIDWSRTAVLAHHATFDITILSWVYKVRPAFILDSLSMARALRGAEAGNSLDKLASVFGLPAKGTALSVSNGYLDELPAHVESQIAPYCCHDVYLAEQIFSKLCMGAPRGLFPIKELRLIDLTLRMYTQPVLELDGELLAKAIEEERDKREGLLARLGVQESDLASNLKFAELLRSLGVDPPMKTSRTTGKPTLALAKNDAMFQALLNGAREDVSSLCEARLLVKSTLERTRAQRFLDISGRGALPFPLKYYAAHTGRYGGSEAINAQNLKRGSFLRQAIYAPDGKLLVVGDLSQIEVRVLAWLADYDDVLSIFRSAGEDVYAAFGAGMFGIPGMTKESHPAMRQSAKSALLGCFGADTRVLTQRGWVPIVSVQATDLVWDGKDWVCHQGVIPQGEKEVLTALGVSATPEHLVLTANGWVEWQKVLTSRSHLKSATSLANLPASHGCTYPMRASGAERIRTSQSCGVRADGKVLLKGLTCAVVEQQDVILAPRKKHTLPVKHGLASPQYAQIPRIGTACWIGLARSSLDAQILKTRYILTMAGAASVYTPHGLKTGLNFYDTLWGSKVGISQNYNWIVSTMMQGTTPATYALSQEVSTCPTREKSKLGTSSPLKLELKVLKQRMPTYDIAYAGPRNRYTILTDEGPLIVHNCGYGLSWATFAAQLLVGFLGAPPVRYDKTFAKQLGVTSEDVSKFVAYEPNLVRMSGIPHSCTDEELLVHCLAAKAIIDKYRAAAWPVVAFWRFCDSMLERCLHGGEEVEYKCLTFRKEEILLPNGMCLRYPGLQKTADGYVYGSKRLFGAKLVENISQALARIIMTDGMLRVSKRYFVAGTVHDELIAVVGESEAQEAADWVKLQMVKEPPWMPGIPLDAGVDFGKRYGEVK